MFTRQELDAALVRLDEQHAKDRAALERAYQLLGTDSPDTPKPSPAAPKAPGLFRGPVTLHAVQALALSMPPRFTLADMLQAAERHAFTTTGESLRQALRNGLQRTPGIKVRQEGGRCVFTKTGA